MSRRDRDNRRPGQAPHPAPRPVVDPAPASVAEMPSAAPPAPAQGAPVPGLPLPLSEPSAAPVEPVVRFRARVRILAGVLGEFAPGDEIPAAVAADGLREGEHFDRAEG